MVRLVIVIVIIIVIIVAYQHVSICIEINFNPIARCSEHAGGISFDELLFPIVSTCHDSQIEHNWLGMTF